MRFFELLRLVKINLMSNKSKGLLTSLGIVVGSATIVLVIAIGQGGKLDVAEQFKNLNAGAIEVVVGQPADTMTEQAMENMGGGMPSPNADGGNMPDFSSGGGMPDFSSGGGMPDFSSGGGFSGGGSMPSGNSSRGGGGSFSGPAMSGKGNTVLTIDDVDDISELVPNIEAVSIVTSDTAAVSGGELDDETEYTVAGVLPEYQQISNLSVQYGEFFTDEDEESKTKVCVMGYGTAQDIFGSAYLAYGDTITIEGKNYEVIGVLASMGTMSSGISPDEAIYVPYATSAKYIFGNDVSPQITAVASDVNEVENVMQNIEAVLTQNYPDTSFTVTDAGSKMEAATSSAETLQMMLIAVASIVFVVGGIGIMNVLFVTVKERTKEIGILKALGSRKREILTEFLMEANFIATLGGIIGVILGFALIPAMELLGTRAEPVAASGLLALAFAILTGTLFGFYPALKASMLTPIEALSQD